MKERHRNKGYTRYYVDPAFWKHTINLINDYLAEAMKDWLYYADWQNKLDKKETVI